MRARVRNEDGWVVVTAISLLAVMLVVGLAAMATVDTGTQMSREQRERESAFNYTEGVLFAQGFALAQGTWPSGVNPPYPLKCESGGAASVQCPSNASVTGNFQGVDFKSGTGWVTRVRDDYGELAGAYDPAVADGALTGELGVCAAPCARDFNEDLELWVQARATAQGEARNVVALLKLEQLQESIPEVAVASGALAVTNNGNHGNTLMVDGTGSKILVRCEPDAAGANNAKCTSYEPGQVSPAPESGAPSRLMTDEQIERFRETAKINGTYHAGCPTEIYKAPIIFVEDCDPKTVNYQGLSADKVSCTPPNPNLKPTCMNTIDDPGLLIFRCGGMQTQSNWTFVGIIYFANGIDGSCPARGNYQCEGQNITTNDVFKSNGGFGVWGVIAAEGGACMKFGSNNFQFRYDDAVFSSLRSYGTVGLVQNTWREMPSDTGA